MLCVMMCLTLADDVLQLILSDNGVGLDNENLQTKTERFGHKLIRAFKQKLSPELTNQSDQGTKIIVDIQDLK